MAVQYRKLLAQTVAALMRETPELGSHAKLAKRCSTPTRKIGARTIGHLLNAEDGPQPQLDTIVAVAEAFKLPPWMLVHPDFDPGTRTVGGALSAEVIDAARKIAGLSADTRRMLFELLEQAPRLDAAPKPVMASEPAGGAAVSEPAMELARAFDELHEIARDHLRQQMKFLRAAQAAAGSPAALQYETTRVRKSTADERIGRQGKKNSRTKKT